MAYWEFLLQKEGDRDWLPLETAHVEISEGRYRIVAHTSHRNAVAEVRLSQFLPSPLPAKQRVLKRIGQTTQDGLMVVMPFTHLAVGRWTVHCCSGQGPSDQSVPSWRYQIQIQVLEIESELDYWDVDLDEPEAAASFSVQSVEPPNASDLPGNQAVPLTAPISPPRLLESAAIADVPLRLQLDQQSIFLQDEATCSLQGYVTTLSEVEGMPREGHLWVQFRNPETSQVLHSEGHPITIDALPRHFTVSVSLPQPLSVRLLVGEMSLWSAASPPQILAIQGFTITLNLDALLEAVAAQGETLTETILDNLAGQTSAEIAAPPREVPFQRLYLPTTGLTLPPTIHHSQDKQPGSPCLPQVPGYRSPRPPETQSAPDIHSPSVPEPSSKTVDLPFFTRPQVGIQGPEAGGRSLEQEAFLPISAAAAQETPDQSATAPDTATNPDFKGRFWSRLNSLAQASTKTAAALKAEMEAAGLNAENSVLAPDIPHQEPLPSDSFSPPETESFQHRPSYEVVVYDADIEPDPASLLPTVHPQTVDAIERSAIPLEEPDNEIPVPQLRLPETALIAGAPLSVTVSLSAYPRRLAVKLWIIDVQSRSLVDRPRWLMSWIPNEAGDNTTSLRLQIPQGSIEVRFEAIAIDLTTQQESHKTTQLRKIIPPDEATMD